MIDRYSAYFYLNLSSPDYCLRETGAEWQSMGLFTSYVFCCSRRAGRLSATFALSISSIFSKSWTHFSQQWRNFSFNPIPWSSLQRFKSRTEPHNNDTTVLNCQFYHNWNRRRELGCSDLQRSSAVAVARIHCRFTFCNVFIATSLSGSLRLTSFKCSISGDWAVSASTWFYEKEIKFQTLGCH